jgi:hypothetical protein
MFCFNRPLLGQDLLRYALALPLPHSLPLVLSVSKLDTWVIWRYRMIKSHYIFRNLSIFTSLLQTFDSVADVLSADSYAAMANTQWPYLTLHKAWSLLIQHSQKWIGRFCLFVRISKFESKNDREPPHIDGIMNGKGNFSLSRKFQLTWEPDMERSSVRKFWKRWDQAMSVRDTDMRASKSRIELIPICILIFRILGQGSAILVEPCPEVRPRSV